MFEMVIGEIDMILGRIRDEKDFSDMVYDIWTNSLSKKEREHGFGRLAARLQRSKGMPVTARISLKPFDASTRPGTVRQAERYSSRRRSISRSPTAVGLVPLRMPDIDRTNLAQRDADTERLTAKRATSKSAAVPT